jgi:hypothetical protein
MNDLVLELFKKMFVFFKIKLFGLPVMGLAAFDKHKLIDIVTQFI